MPAGQLGPSRTPHPVACSGEREPAVPSRLGSVRTDVAADAVVASADPGGDGVHVDHGGGVHTDEGADSDRAVVLGHCLQIECGHDVHRMSDAGVVALNGEFGWAGAVDLD